MDRIISAARAIVSARLSRSPLEPLPDSARPRDEAEAYRVQEAVHAMLGEAGRGRLAGYKIGCTTSVMQRYLQIPNPCAGGVLADVVHENGAALEWGGFVRVGIECEIAVRLREDLSPADGSITQSRIVGAIGTYMPAIEIVDDRYADWRKMDTPTLIADDFFAAGCVLGDPVERDAAPELSTLVGRTQINGVEVGRGTGADVMGHPHRALEWLANNLAQRGTMLRKGQIVLTGSLVQTVWLAPGDRVVVNIDGLGTASLGTASLGAASLDLANAP